MLHHGGYLIGMHRYWWLFWVALIGLAMFGPWLRPPRRDRPPQESPHELLRRRLAAGEITPQEYEQRKALLDRDGSPSPP